MSEDKIVVALIVVASITFAFVGWIAGVEMTGKAWQTECVKRDFAEFNQKTGEWQWKSGEKTKEQK